MSTTPAELTPDDVRGFIAPAWPRGIEIGGEPLTLRRMRPDDIDRLHTFFLTLPASDLMFLRRDVTDGSEINRWAGEIERGEAVTLIALANDTVMGESTLHLSDVPWTRHVGVVRVVTAREQRGRGLGRLLLEEMCALALSLGIEKLVAETTAAQTSAQRLLRDLGFVETARLPNFVKDRAHHPHDLIMLIRDIAEPAARQGIPPDGRVIAWRCTACGGVSHATEPPNRCPDCGAGPGWVLRIDEE